MTKLAWHKVSFGYRGGTLFDRESVIVFGGDSRAGQVAVVLGRSGSGKSTFLKLSAGLLSARSGDVRCSPANARISYVTQDAAIIEHMSAEANARLCSVLKGTRTFFSEEVFQRLAERLAMSEVFARDAGGGELSGGERQRVALIRALSTEPAVLFLDEPCRGLDHAIALDFLVDLRELVKELGVCILMVTHDAEQARIMADRFIVVERRPMDKVARVTSWLADAELAAPPSFEACQVLMSEPYTALLGYVHGERVMAPGVDAPLVVGVNSVARDAREVVIVVRAGQVEWNSRGGMACQEVRRGNGASVVVFGGRGSDDRRTSVFGPGSGVHIERFRVVGPAWVYARDGAYVGSVGPMAGD